VGCRACPPFVGAAAQPDGHVVSDPDSFWPLEQRYPGAFTRAGATEVAAVFQGCESHAQNYGGTLLVTQTARGFTPGAYFVGVHPSSCQPYHRADGRDLLVCQWSDAHQSSAFTQVFVYDFVRGTQDSERGWTSLVNVHDNSALACMGMLSGSGLHQGHVVGFRFEDRNGDGQLDLVVDVEHKHTMPSPSLDASVAGACKAAAPAKADDLPHIDVATLFGAPVPRTLVFLYANGSFHADAPTAAALKDL
jgi:hypothetical protein